MDYEYGTPASYEWLRRLGHPAAANCRKTIAFAHWSVRPKAIAIWQKVLGTPVLGRDSIVFIGPETGLPESTVDTHKTAFVTGGARGIGRATSLLLAQRGYAVCINFLQSVHAAKDLVAQIRSSGGRAVCVQGDVSDHGDVLDMFDECTREFGSVDLLVNNAGILAPLAPLANMQPDRIYRTLAVNLAGTMMCAREAVRRMSRSAGGAGGAIVNVSSAAVRSGSPNAYVDYAAAKAAIDVFTLGLAREVAAEGVRVNAVRPGFVDTELHATTGGPMRLRAVSSDIPMRRLAAASEIAVAIAWLASLEASYVTGSVLDVAGGR